MNGVRFNVIRAWELFLCSYCLWTDLIWTKDNDLLRLIVFLAFFRFGNILVHEKASTCKLNHLFAFFCTKAKHWDLFAILEVAEKDQVLFNHSNHFWFTLGKVIGSLVFTCCSVIAKTEVSVQEAVFANFARSDIREVARYHVDTKVFSIQSRCKPKGLPLLTSEKHRIGKSKHSSGLNCKRLSTERKLLARFYLLGLGRILKQR